jgi:hypothetical protein
MPEVCLGSADGYVLWVKNLLERKVQGPSLATAELQVLVDCIELQMNCFAILSSNFCNFKISQSTYLRNWCL